MTSPLLAPRAPEKLESVSACLGFTERSQDKLYFYTYEPPEGVAQTNLAIIEKSVTIANARLVANQSSLDRQGYALVAHHTAVRDFWDEAQTLALGHPEAAEIVKAATGARRVVVFDHTLRRRTGDPDRSPNAPRQPVSRVHVDQTLASGPQRVRDIMGDEAEALLSRRAAIINVWRPVRHQARDWPLVLGDASSIDPADLLPCDQVFRHRRGETYGLAFNPAQSWRYFPDLALDECLLIKCWDSDETVARFAPHAAFADPTTPPGTPPRESIEFRTIAFFD
jgi:hypothetical protein